MFITSITSQGQITIPSALRKKYKLTAPGKAVVRDTQGTIVIEPVIEAKNIQGSLHAYALQGKTIDEIMSLENEAIESAWAE